MNAQLAEVEGEFNSALVRLRQLRTSVPAATWRRRPAPERWSPGECVAHLNLTSATMVPIVRGALDEARRSGMAAPARYRRDLVGWLLWKSLGQVGRFKTKTIPAWVPSGELPPDVLVAQFEQWQAEQVALVRESDGLPIHAMKITSPVDARARYSVFSALSILARHQHRHLWQAEQASR